MGISDEDTLCNEVIGMPSYLDAKSDFEKQNLCVIEDG